MISRITPFYCSNRQQTDLLTVRATFLQMKLEKRKLEGEMHPDIKIQVSCDMKQSKGEMHQDIKIQVSFDMKQSILGCCS